MPGLSRREILQLSVLLLAVPFQFWLTSQQQLVPNLRTKAFKDVVDQARVFVKKWFVPKSWIDTCRSAWQWIAHVTPVSKFEESLSSDSETDPNSDESPAKEVLELRERQQKGHFASSLKPRSDRSEKIKFRVGQVVQHIKNGYRGVVVGWDPQANAPNDWLKQSGEENQDWMHQPNYLILVDTRDRPEPQFTYVPQDNLKIKKHARVIHPKLYDYFKDYDGAQYVPRLWLQIIYPKD